jgi:hypothetical protein
VSGVATLLFLYVSLLIAKEVGCFRQKCALDTSLRAKPFSILLRSQLNARFLNLLDSYLTDSDSFTLL